jgi:hypothetical protein
VAYGAAHNQSLSYWPVGMTPVSEASPAVPSAYHGSRPQELPNQEHQMTASHYWLAQWLDENEIHSEWELDHTLNSQSGFNGLMEAIFKAAQDFRASQEMRKGEAEYPDSNVLSDSIVAGRKLDLSGKASCSSYNCLRQGIDSTFKRVWHYFDQIVVEGLAPDWLAQEIESANAERIPFTILKIRDQARLLLYLRDIGAERFVVFHPRSYFCQEHWAEHARELGLAAAVNESRREKTVRDIIKSSEFDIRKGNYGE